VGTAIPESEPITLSTTVQDRQRYPHAFLKIVQRCLKEVSTRVMVPGLGMVLRP